MLRYCVFQSYIYEPDECGNGAIRAYCDLENIACINKDCAIPSNLTRGATLLVDIELCKKEYKFRYTDRAYYMRSIFVVMPQDNRSAIEYLKNMDIEGLSENVAIRFIEAFGTDIEDTLKSKSDEELISEFATHMKEVKRKHEERMDEANKLCASVSCLQTTGGVKAYEVSAPRRATLRKCVVAGLRRVIETKNSAYEVYNAFYDTGVKYSDIHRLFRQIEIERGETPTEQEVIKLLRDPQTNPDGTAPAGCYTIGRRAKLNFLIVDRIAKRCDYLAYSRERIAELALYSARSLADCGHTWFTIDHIYNVAKYRQKKTAFPDISISKNALYAAIKSAPSIFKAMKVEGVERIHLMSLYNDEKDIAYHTERINDRGTRYEYDSRYVDKLELESGITYSKSQRECFDLLASSGINIITGGAGTGKTTVISGLLRVFTDLNPAASVALCAPTGRAAQRMTELCAAYGSNVRASTIHKLLEIRPCESGDSTPYSQDSPLPADLIVVDEMSMVGAHLFSVLVKTIKRGALVFLCGDYAQLPSVDAGKVFNDLISSNKFSTIRLTVNYRQSQTRGNGLIISNSDKISRGDINIATGVDFAVAYCETAEDMQNEVLRRITSERDQTILSTVKDGQAGTRELNKKLQPLVNPNPASVMEYGSAIYGVGDSILMNANNYNIGYVNGDIGKIINICDDIISVDIGGEKKFIDRKSIADMSLAYAMTIHKSQGSEYEKVMIVLSDAAPNMLARNLLYTAVTRAKRKVTIIGRKEDIEEAINRNTSNMRRTSLCWFLKHKEERR